MRNVNKFNGFENYLILEGLEQVRLQMIQEIRDTEANGKIPIMTEGYVDMVINDAIAKVKHHTVKSKH